MNASESTARSTQPTRREFSKQVAILAVAPVAAASAQAQPKTDPLLASAEALTELVRQRAGKNLTEEQLTLVKQGILRRLNSAELLKKVKLQNGDEPAFQFKADLP